MEFLERERCLADLANWLSDTPQRGGCVALIGGEAGIGKTTLLHQFSKQQRDVQVLWGACDDLFTPRPLGPFHDIAQQTQGALLAAINSGANREELFTAALCELQRAPTLIVLEDMHWADEATLDLLKYLGRRVTRTRALIAVTYRDVEVGSHHPLRFVIGDLPRASTRKMSLSPLSEAAVAQLAKSTGRTTKGIYEITGGNPLFVTEVLAASTDTVPATVSDAVLARAVKLSPAARDIAELVCVVPGKVEAWLLEQIVRPDTIGIESCLSIGMVSSEDSSLAYRHELVRRALEDSLSTQRRRSLHAKILAVLALRPEISAARLAHHANGAHDAESVLKYARVAATQAAAVGAHREAASHYQVALQYSAALSPFERARLQEKLAFECYLTSHHERAIEAREAALAIWRSLADRMREGDTLRWLSRLSWFVGRRAEADQYGADAVTTLESLPPSAELAMAYANRAQLDMEAHETDSAITWAGRAIALAEPGSNDEILSDALDTRGTARLIAGDTSGWADLHRSLQLALARGIQVQVARAYANLCAMAVSRRQYADALNFLQPGLEYCEKHDLDSWWLLLVTHRARMKFEQGDWTGAGNDAEAVLCHARSTPVTRIPTLRVLGHLRIRRGDPDANGPLDEAGALTGSLHELQRIGALAAVRAEAAWLAGDYAEVVREAQAAYERVSQLPDPRMKGELAAWLWRVKALDEPPIDIADPYAMEISGDWRDTARAWQALGCRYEQAIVLGWYGGELEQREALAIFDQLGASPAAEALRRQMRTSGVRRIPRGERTSTRRNPHGLTQREAEILSLVSDGLRNAAIAKRLHVSTRTVDHHVSSILAKLGAQSRAEAVAVARRSASSPV